MGVLCKPIDRSSDGLQQFVCVYRLSYEWLAGSLNRNEDRAIVVCADKHSGDAKVESSELLVELEATDSRQAEIDNRAVSNGLTFEVVLSRSECSNDVAVRSEQARNSTTDILVIFYENQIAHVGNRQRMRRHTELPI